MADKVENPDVEKVPRVSTLQDSSEDVHPHKDWWAWEIFGIVGSALCIIGLCLFVRQYDGQPLPSWAYKQAPGTILIGTPPSNRPSVSLNSIIGLFSTAGKVMLLIPITRGLGQLKWVWFSEEHRQLSDFEVFDSATRGASGSLFLLWTLKGRHLAALGALVMILSLAYDPLVQNLVSYPTLYHDYSYSDPLGKAWVANTRNFEVRNWIYDVESGNLTDQIKGQVLSALYDMGDATRTTSAAWSIPMHVCPSGNCTYPATPNIGAWLSCTNLEEKLIKNCTYDASKGDTDPEEPGCDISLPNGLNLSAPDGSRSRAAVVNTTLKSGLEPMVYHDRKASIAIIQFIRVYDIGMYWNQTNATTDLQAGECVISPAIITTASSHGFTRSAVKDLGEVVLWAETHDSVFDNADLVNGTVVLKPPANKTSNINPNDEFTISSEAFQGLRDYSNFIFPSYVEFVNLKHRRYRSSYGDNDVAFFMHTQTSLVNDASADAFTKDNSLAGALWWMTQALRVGMQSSVVKNAQQDNDSGDSNGSQRGYQHLVEDKLAVPGTSWRAITSVKITWYWIFLPVLLWTMATTFILGVIWRTKRSGVRTWRTNPLAVIFLGLGENEKQSVLEHNMTANGLAKRAAQLNVRLHMDEKEATLRHRV